MALSLCVGLLIDDAIVVRENIVRHVQLGADHRTAALDGTKEIALAVLATTFSIVAVFLPVGFMSGIIGRFFHQFGVTVAAAVLISMFVSFTLDPMLSSIWPDPALHVRGTRHLARLLAFFERGVERLAQFYQRLLGWSLRHRITTLSVAAATFFGSLFLVPLDRHRVRTECRFFHYADWLEHARGNVAGSDRRQSPPGRSSTRVIPRGAL